MSAGKIPPFPHTASKTTPLSSPTSLLSSTRWRAAIWLVLPLWRRAVSKYGRWTLPWWMGKNFERSWRRRWGRSANVWRRQWKVSFRAAETLRRRKTWNSQDSPPKKNYSFLPSTVATSRSAGLNYQNGPKTPTPLAKNDTSLDSSDLFLYELKPSWSRSSLSVLLLEVLELSGCRTTSLRNCSYSLPSLTF